MFIDHDVVRNLVYIRRHAERWDTATTIKYGKMKVGRSDDDQGQPLARHRHNCIPRPAPGDQVR